jgi:hypothetical protein
MKPLALLFLPCLLLAQPPFSKFVEYEPDGTDSIQNFRKLLGPTGVGFEADSSLKLVTLWSGNQSKLDEAEQLIKKYYKPKAGSAPTQLDRNVELTLHVLHAKMNSTEPNDTPAILAPVIQQLKQATSLTSFRVVETQILRIRSGKKVETSGILVWNDAPEHNAPNYQFRTEVYIQGASIRTDNLNFGVRIPYKVNESTYQYREVGIISSFDMKPGQYTVVGKTNASSKDGALVLILSGKIVD